jgi:hypothetical protein
MSSWLPAIWLLLYLYLSAFLGPRWSFHGVGFLQCIVVSKRHFRCPVSVFTGPGLWDDLCSGCLPFIAVLRGLREAHGVGHLDIVRAHTATLNVAIVARSLHPRDEGG